MREIAGSGLATLLRFLMFSGFAAQRAGLSPPALFAAKIAATLAEDCGPCTQLVVTMAEREGVSPTMLVFCSRVDRKMPSPTPRSPFYLRARCCGMIWRPAIPYVQRSSLPGDKRAWCPWLSRSRRRASFRR